jgi:ATP-dependent DNA helicase RecQ
MSGGFVLAPHSNSRAPALLGPLMTSRSSPAAHAAPASAALPAAVRQSLHTIFGIRRLRQGQEQVIARALAGEDTLAIMPTGAGKSLCYQLPALHLQGTTLVVSPLIALMKDQAGKLEAAGIVVEQFNSAVPKPEQEASLQRLASGRSEIVFATPERLADPDFMTHLKSRRIALFVVDEAHCISQWGHDFRPAFLEIGAAVEALGRPPVLALTATAPPEVIEDILRQFDRPRMQLVDTGMYRPNLRLQAVQCVSETEKLDRVREALGRAEGTGIIYTATVKACEQLHEQLSASGESVTRYHGRLPRTERADNQDRFMRGEVRVMVATNAFGMGIDKPDLRFVLHYQMTGSLEAYYQEAGRAGRDGKAADCALLFDRRDRQVQQFFLARRYPTADDLQQVHGALAAAGTPLRQEELVQRLPGLAKQRVAVALHLLRDNRLARADRRRAWQVLSQDTDRSLFERLAREYEERAERDHEALERMVFYAQTGYCRWRVLLEYFDEPLPFEHEHCGICDNCLRVKEEPPAATEQTRPGVRGERQGRLASETSVRWQPEDEVRVPRYGTGRVERASLDEVEVRFADGSSRRFLASYVQPAGNRQRAAAAQPAAASAGE